MEIDRISHERLTGGSLPKYRLLNHTSGKEIL
jgi:hypothetical protein